MSQTEPTRMPEMMSHDRADLDALLASTVVGHVGFVDENGGPGVLPTAVVGWDDRLVVHGSTGSRWMRLVTGVPVAVSIAAVDGVIVARSAFESSLAYRSAVVFGTLQELAGEEKLAALDALTDRLIPGRVAEVRRPTAKELAATSVMAMPLTTWSLRVSNGWADDAEADLDGSAWSGQIRFEDRLSTFCSAPDLKAGIASPDSVTWFRAAH